MTATLKTEEPQVRPCQITELSHIGGDFHHKWNPNDPTSVSEAAALFDKLRKKGFLMFKVNRDNQPEMVTKFDPNDKELLFHSEIVASPPMAGG